MNLTPTPTYVYSTATPAALLSLGFLTTSFYLSSSSRPLALERMTQVYTSLCGCEGPELLQPRTSGPAPAEISHFCRSQPVSTTPDQDSPTPRRLTPRPMGRELEHEPASGGADPGFAFDNRRRDLKMSLRRELHLGLGLLQDARRRSAPLRSSGRWLTLQTEGWAWTVRMLEEPVPGRGLLRRGWGAFCSQERLRGQGAVAGVLGGCWLPPFGGVDADLNGETRLDRLPVGSSGDRTARKAGHARGGAGSSPGCASAGAPRPPFSFPGSSRLPASASPRPRARRPRLGRASAPRPRRRTQRLTAPLSPQHAHQCRRSHAHFPVCLYPGPPYPRAQVILFPLIPSLGSRPSLPFILLSPISLSGPWAACLRGPLPNRAPPLAEHRLLTARPAGPIRHTAAPHLRPHPCWPRFSFSENAMYMY